MNGPARDRLAPRTVLAGILVLVAVVYAPTLGFAFVYDDHWTLVSNGFCRVPSAWPDLLGPRAQRLGVPDAFRPTSVAWTCLTYQVFGLSSTLHHAASLCLHLAVTALWAGWLARLGVGAAIRLGATAVFGTMAVHAEPIAVVSYHEDLLAAVLGLLGMLAAQRHLEILSSAPARWGMRLTWGIAAACALAMATGAKASVVPLPVVWWGAQRWLGHSPPRRMRTEPALALAAGVAAALVLRSVAWGGLVPYDASSSRLWVHHVGWSSVLAQSVQIHASYAVQFFVPGGLSPEYVDAGATWSEPGTLRGAIAMLGALALGLRLDRTGRGAGAFAIFGTALLMLPTSNLWPMPNLRADRFVYLSSMPASLGIAVVLEQIGRRLASGRARPELGWAPMVAWVMIQGSASRAAITPYRSDTRLWTIASRRAPGSARAQAVLGELAVAEGDRRGPATPVPERDLDAATRCERAVELDPTDPLGHLCRARLATWREDWTAAHQAFSAAERLHPQHPERAWLGLAETTLELTTVPYPERVRQALSWLDRAEASRPFEPEVFAVSGWIRHQLGRPEEARPRYERAMMLHPERLDVRARAVELELDLGHPSAVAQIWTVGERLPTPLARRLRDARIHLEASARP